ncbi:sulfatase-like hydrolase/transferase [Brenneria sp. g21c3]|uniref:sulfatase-like hydrolase/transferase n=1 Tax=Brenneria sp. g21c3 TaxID=3093893 RepID=UPI002ECB9C08|nr:sulfatase-like hydrolase/transferase [Brenneria sp. g21c3]
MAAAQPNILMIVSDDQGYWAMHHAGTQDIYTPNLDRLARSGKRFDSLYCVSPVCSPARASLMTGRIPSAHGIHDWIRAGNASIETEFHHRLIQYLDRHQTMVEILAQAGYTCGLSGKWHLGDTHIPHRGFSYWQAYATGGGAYQSPTMIQNGEVQRVDGYLTDIITSNALTFLAQQSGQAPWYLSVHYTAPHAPWEENQHKPEDFDRYYPDCAFSDLPAPPMHADFYNPDNFPKDEDARKRMLSGYFAAVTAMDRGIGEILDALESRGQLDNTLVIFTSDNGMNMGHHGIYGKGNGTYPQNLFETSVKVPGIFMHRSRIAPGLLKGLYSHYDFMPTILAYAQLEHLIPEGLPGRDISQVLKADAPEEAGYVVVFDEYGPNRMIRAGRWKYIHRYAGGCELYDLENDPAEARNLVAEPDKSTIIADLFDRLQAWFARFGTTAMDGAIQPVMGGGQIDRVGGEGVDGAIFVDHRDKLHR